MLSTCRIRRRFGRLNGGHVADRHDYQRSDAGLRCNSNDLLEATNPVTSAHTMMFTLLETNTT
jgi:hypothetical protein